MKNSSLQNRSIYHDLLRIFASLAVICIHVICDCLTWESKQYLTSTWEYLNVFDSLSRFAVPIFIMLSGSFMLDKYEHGSLKKLYFKNIFRLVCALCFWKVFHATSMALKIYIFDTSLNVADLIFQQLQPRSHLWFIPMLIVLYAITPLVKDLCKRKQNEQYFILLATIPMLFNFINSFLEKNLFESWFEHTNFEFISGYTVYYILGHYLNKYDIHKKYRILIYLSAVISVIFTVFASRHHYISGNHGDPFVFSYLSPTTFLFSIAVYLLFKYNILKINFKERTQTFITKFSSLTFGIYLSHMFFVKVLNQTPLTVENIHPLVSVPLVTVVIFILCAITTWIISKIPVLKKYII